MKWIKIERDEKGIATDECLSNIQSSIPCVVCLQTEEGKYYDMVHIPWDMANNLEDIRLQTKYTYYLPIPKLNKTTEF